PTAQERAAADLDAIAAAAAANARTGSIDSFANAVLHRYEAPITNANAAEIIAAQADRDPDMTNSQRWSLTGQSNAPPQRPLGRWTPPGEVVPPPVVAPPAPSHAAPPAAPSQAPGAAPR